MQMHHAAHHRFSIPTPAARACIIPAEYDCEARHEKGRRIHEQWTRQCRPSSGHQSLARYRGQGGRHHRSPTREKVFGGGQCGDGERSYYICTCRGCGEVGEERKEQKEKFCACYSGVIGSSPILGRRNLIFDVDTSDRVGLVPMLTTKRRSHVQSERVRFVNKMITGTKYSLVIMIIARSRS